MGISGLWQDLYAYGQWWVCWLGEGIIHAIEVEREDELTNREKSSREKKGSRGKEAMEAHR